MLREIGSVDHVKHFVEEVKSGRGGRLMGFGHRVYKNYDPRAQVIKKLADQVFEILGAESPLLQVAIELEKIALNDEYFVQRKLYPNVDFYSGLIYEALEIPVDMFPVMFAIPRAAGWLAQWEEMLVDREQRIARPRQIYTGEDKRDFVSIENRK
jgi:citrate synthase